MGTVELLCEVCGMCKGYEGGLRGICYVWCVGLKVCGTVRVHCKWGWRTIYLEWSGDLYRKAAKKH